uniref:Uncharacterized protein n=1 Tax=Arundo donax TaxID=35708 RepID=A0A0A9DA63_ARUDO
MVVLGMTAHLPRQRASRRRSTCSYFTPGATARGYHGRTPWGRLSCLCPTWPETILMDLFHFYLITSSRSHLAQGKLSTTKVGFS